MDNQRVCRKCGVEFTTTNCSNCKSIRDKARKLKARLFVYTYLLQHPCVDCGNDDIDVLDFDHVRGEKYKTINTMIKERDSIVKLQEEIEKCEIRCANCHRKRHAIENGHRVDLWIN